MQTIKKFLLIILDFDNKTLFFQSILVFGLIALFGLNFGFNEKLLTWAKSLSAHFFGTNDVKKFALKYVVTLAFSSLILVKSVFAIIAILKYNHNVN